MSYFSSMLRSARRSCSVGLSVILMSVCGTGAAFAQDDPRYVLPSAEPATPQRAPGVEQDSQDASQDSEDSENSTPRAVVDTRTKSYVLEGLIFAALCGAALFAVCRSSPRGN